MKCKNCGKAVNIVMPGLVYTHTVSQRSMCHDAYGYADPGAGVGKVFGTAR